MIIKAIKRFVKHLAGQSARSRAAKSMSQTSSQMMVSMVMDTQEDDIDCDSTFELMNQYAEMLAKGENVEKMLPKVYKHIRSCPDCREELEALLRIIIKDPALKNLHF